MDVQLKRGTLDACTLAILYREESYGYKIVKDMSKYIEISESTLYPILKRLEDKSFVNVNSVEHNGRLRKYYKITDLGKEKIKEFKTEWKTISKVYNFICEVTDHDEE